MCLVRSTFLRVESSYTGYTIIMMNSSQYFKKKYMPYSGGAANLLRRRGREEGCAQVAKATLWPCTVVANEIGNNYFGPPPSISWCDLTGSKLFSQFGMYIPLLQSERRWGL